MDVGPPPPPPPTHGPTSAPTAVAQPGAPGTPKQPPTAAPTPVPLPAVVLPDPVVGQPLLVIDASVGVSTTKVGAVREDTTTITALPRKILFKLQSFIPKFYLDLKK